MVRTIDGNERRRLLSEAVWRIVRRDGFQAASVRTVAAEASLSTGSVRHFFTTQDELHVFAMEALIDRVSGRVRAVADTHFATAAAPADSRAAVRAVLLELLPLDEEREDLFRSQLQFIARATVSDVLRPMAARLADEVDSLVFRMVRTLVDAGAARADLDVTSAAKALALLLDGIDLRLLTAPDTLTAQEAAGLVDEYLDRWSPR